MVINAAMTGGSMDIEDKNISKKSIKIYNYFYVVEYFLLFLVTLMCMTINY
jgi:hypothetical protein